MGLKSRHLTLPSVLIPYFDIPKYQGVPISYHLFGKYLLPGKAVCGVNLILNRHHYNKQRQKRGPAFTWINFEKWIK
jgi:hypothetical protein